MAGDAPARTAQLDSPRHARSASVDAVGVGAAGCRGDGACDGTVSAQTVPPATNTASTHPPRHRDRFGISNCSSGASPGSLSERNSTLIAHHRAARRPPALLYCPAQCSCAQTSPTRGARICRWSRASPRRWNHERRCQIRDFVHRHAGAWTPTTPSWATRTERSVPLQLLGLRGADSGVGDDHVMDRPSTVIDHIENRTGHFPTALQRKLLFYLVV